MAKKKVYKPLGVRSNLGDLVKVVGGGFGTVCGFTAHHIELQTLSQRRYNGWVAGYRLIRGAVWTFSGPMQTDKFGGDDDV